MGDENIENLVSSTFCAFPFERRVITPNGDIRPCCNYTGDLGTIKTGLDAVKIEDLKKSLLSNHKHQGCNKCWQLEARGLGTERTRERTTYNDNVKFLEINLSNICNLKCRMCGSDSSSAWIRDEQMLSDSDVSTFRPIEGQRLVKSFPNETALHEFFETIDFSHLEKISFLGGEPFLQTQLPFVLQYLINKNNVQMTIHLTTNGTTVDLEILRLLSKFHRFELRLSIEATGSLYQYIRGGAISLKVVEANLVLIKEQCPNVCFSLSCALGAYSIFALADLYLWCRQHIPGFEKEHIGKSWYSIYYPNYLCMRAIPLSVRLNALDQNIARLNSAGVSGLEFRSQFGALLQMEDDHQVEDLKNFVTFTRKLDQLRNESIEVAIPEYNDLFVEVEDPNAKELACYAPKFFLNITNHGEIRPCSAFRSNFGTIQNYNPEEKQRLLKALESGVSHSGCGECRHRESLGIGSARIPAKFRRYLPEALEKLELNLSNACNLKCRMCSADSSSAWIQDEMALREDPVTRAFRDEAKLRTLNVFPTKADLYAFLDGLNLQKLKSINIKGGEPLIQKRVFETLEYLRDRDIKNIVVLFTTNGTVVPDQLAILQNFAKVKFFVSVDAEGDLYRYIRGGSKFSIENIYHNIQKLRKIENAEVDIVACVGALNAFNLADLYNWMNQATGSLKDSKYVEGHWTSIYSPNYLSMLALPLAMRRRALEHNLERLSLLGLHSQDLEKVLAAYLDLNSEHNPILTKQFLQFTKKTDQLRNENLINVEPEFSNLLLSNEPVEPVPGPRLRKLTRWLTGLRHVSMTKPADRPPTTQATKFVTRR